MFAGNIFGLEQRAESSELLGRIVSEFISEYRAIFEIESTLETAHDHDIPWDRKRHDNEEDECPEDIKAM